MHFVQFYKISGGYRSQPAAPPGYSCEIWRPGLLQARPAGVPWYPFAVWWLFHYLHVFANRGYAIVIIRFQDEVVHRSVITPRYFRFPFMARSDLQIGDTWTHESHRGKGLATIALRAAVAAAGDRNCWYLVGEDNLSSIRVAEKVGFRLTGTGSRKSRFGLAIIGTFELRESNLQPS